MSALERETAAERCETPGCVRHAEPYSAYCSACNHGLEPEERKPDMARIAAQYRRCADLIRTRHPEGAAWMEARAKAIEADVPSAAVAPERVPDVLRDVVERDVVERDDFADEATA